MKKDRNKKAGTDAEEIISVNEIEKLKTMNLEDIILILHQEKLDSKWKKCLEERKYLDEDDFISENYGKRLNEQGDRFNELNLSLGLIPTAAEKFSQFITLWIFNNELKNEELIKHFITIAQRINSFSGKHESNEELINNMDKKMAALEKTICKQQREIEKLRQKKWKFFKKEPA